MSKKKPRPTPVPTEYVPHLIDAHTHLASIKSDTSELLARAAAAGVEKICTVGDGLTEAEQALATAQEFPHVFAACAIHPTKADQLDLPTRERIERLVADPECVAVGETGLDKYWLVHDPDRTASLAVQEAALRWHIDLAVKYDKVLMIHNREADAELLQILADSPAPSSVILHCFSSPLDMAKTAIDRGYVLSFAGNVTFKRNDELREAAKIAPADQLLVETDAPYMTPEPFRGAHNEPALIGHTARVLAEVRGVPVAQLAEVMSETFSRVYRK